MDFVRSLRRTAGVTQSALARAAGTSQPTIAAYEAGTKSPTVDTLRRLSASVRLEPTMEFHPRTTREERRSLALHEAIAERLRENPEPALERARATLERMAAGPAASSQSIREWHVLLDRPLEALLRLLVDRDPWARELRHVTPFAGILTAAERAAVYRAFAEREGSAAS
jgi:transcriptional regulator with XRE-family HTH domain